jgi:hypothetical protein
MMRDAWLQPYWQESLRRMADSLRDVTMALAMLRYCAERQREQEGRVADEVVWGLQAFEQAQAALEHGLRYLLGVRGDNRDV